MTLRYAAYALTLLMASHLCAALAAYGYRRRHAPGALCFALWMAAAAGWTGFAAVEACVTSLPAKILLAKMQCLCVAAGPYFLLLFCAEYSRRSSVRERWLKSWSAAPAIALVAAAFTNEHHRLVWESVRLVDDHAGASAQYSPGPLLLAYAVYAVALAVIGMRWVVGVVRLSPGGARARVVLLVTGVALPVVGFALDMMGLSPIPGLEIGPLALAAMGVCLALAVVRYQMLGLVSVARNAAVDQMSDAAIVFDAQGRVADLNPAAQALLGPSAVVGQLASALAPPWSEWLQRGADSARTGGTVTLGQAPVERHLEARWTPLVDRMGILSGELVAIRDVTEQYVAQAAVAASEAKYRALVEYSPDAIFVHQDGRLVFVNPAAVRLLGASRPVDLIGASIMDHIHPMDRDLVLRRIDATRRGEAAPAVEERFIRLDGSVVEVEVAGLPFTHEGRPATQSVARDISQRKRAEAEIVRLNIDLERRIRERTGELEVANEELNAFAYSVSHDLRAPLRAVDGFGGILEQDYSDKLDEQGVRMLANIRSASRQMAQLIDDLLGLSRVTRAELTRSTADLSEAARSVAADLTASDPGREVEFVIPAGVEADADPSLARIVLDNLLRNAWKYTSKTEQARIEFGVTCGPAPLEFYVKDNGAGFDMQYAGMLFRPFSRLHRPDEFEGSGIGLATVQRIVRRHGGTIRAEGAVGIGATFYFTFGA